MPLLFFIQEAAVMKTVKNALRSGAADGNSLFALTRKRQMWIVSCANSE